MKILEKHELVNKNGDKTGKILTRIEAHDFNNIPDGYYMPLVGVVIINNKNEMLLEKRSRLKKVNANKWGICGGKVNLKETLIEAAIRDTLEEIGILLNKDALKFLSKDMNQNAYFTIYYATKNIDINECILQKEELEEVKYFKIEELQNLDSEGFEWLENLKKVIKYGN